MYSTILYDVKDGKATITLNRPDVYNAFNDEMTYELQAVFKEVNKNKEVRVVIVTGAGKAFCSGQDLKATRDSANFSFSDSVKNRYNPLISGMRNLPKACAACWRSVEKSERISGRRSYAITAR